VEYSAASLTPRSGLVSKAHTKSQLCLDHQNVEPIYYIVFAAAGGG
jgi:hypothetical protein